MTSPGGDSRKKKKNQYKMLRFHSESKCLLKREIVSIKPIKEKFVFNVAFQGVLQNIINKVWIKKDWFILKYLFPQRIGSVFQRNRNFSELIIITAFGRFRLPELCW